MKSENASSRASGRLCFHGGLPHWRWHRANFMANPSNCRLDDTDEPTRRIVRFLKEGSDPSLATAAAIFAANDHVRWRIEASLLANTSDDDIARRMNVDSSVIALYETTFYDVRSRLQGTWVVFNALGNGWNALHGPTDDASLLRWSGFTKGQVMLDVIVAAMIGIGREQYPPATLAKAKLLVAFFRKLPSMSKEQILNLAFRLTESQQESASDTKELKAWDAIILEQLACQTVKSSGEAVGVSHNTRAVA